MLVYSFDSLPLSLSMKVDVIYKSEALLKMHEHFISCLMIYGITKLKDNFRKIEMQAKRKKQ